MPKKTKKKDSALKSVGAGVKKIAGATAVHQSEKAAFEQKGGQDFNNWMLQKGKRDKLKRIVATSKARRGVVSGIKNLGVVSGIKKKKP